jgi:hypothetical protein
MDSEHTPTGQDMVGPDHVVPAEENTAEQRLRRRVSPYSLVPALTLVALQFMKEDQPSLWDIIIKGIGRS